MTNDRKATLAHERPWTPGPWRTDDQGVEAGWWAVTTDSGAWVAQTERCFRWDEETANRDLIALAPEMAEAILALDETCPNCGGEGCLLFAGMHALAEKLREIGATDA